ncbi:hypothetical protein A9Q99_10215 [Gammaproteobacteria bacterium 45_16_T64]|nr:hypothetical protein A9Q99_10215 [Gammaproteobacteria bacterium 45_16_T64]
MSKPKIDLYDSVGLGLIICFESGVVFSNQTGGGSCLHPEIEGVYVPLRNDYTEEEKTFMSPELDLAEHFEGSKWQGAGATNGIDPEDSDTIQSILNNAGLESIEIDRNKLHLSHEAWIYVKINGDESKEFPVFEGFSPYPIPGVLTWSNSD